VLGQHVLALGLVGRHLSTGQGAEGHDARPGLTGGAEGGRAGHVDPVALHGDALGKTGRRRYLGKDLRVAKGPGLGRFNGRQRRRPEQEAAESDLHRSPHLAALERLAPRCVEDFTVGGQRVDGRGVGVFDHEHTLRPGRSRHESGDHSTGHPTNHHIISLALIHVPGEKLSTASR